MRKVVSLIIASVFIAGMWSELRSQDNIQSESQSDSITYKTSPFQVTFLFPPFSTNGFANPNYINRMSLNLFLGTSGGVDGAELGGFINIDRYFVRGIQLAGFGNTVGQFVDGVQLAGFYNVAGGDVKYVQGAGFVNVTGGKQFGLQGAGFTNVVAGDVFGIQGSGFMNLAGGKMTGVQGAGFMNIAGDTLSGLQGAGFMNIAGGANSGIQGAGFGNIAGKGKVNVQGAGFFNRADHVEGIQGAGFFNKAGYVKGVQAAGFLNVCDSIDGVPIGFINIVKNGGYSQFEMAMTETQYFALSYKLGVEKLYTIYTVGKAIRPSSRWIYGVGLGTRWGLTENTNLNVEAVSMWEFYMGDSRSPRFFNHARLSNLNQLAVTFSRELGDRAEVFVGPSLNVSVASTNPDYNPNIPWEPLAPRWAMYDRTFNNYLDTNVSIWIGVKGGLRF